MRNYIIYLQLCLLCDLPLRLLFLQIHFVTIDRIIRRTCTGPNVSTLVGADLCDRDDVQKMLNETGSDSIRCIFNPGAAKRIRLSTSCHSSLPTGVANNVEQGYFRANEIGEHSLLYNPPPDGIDARYGSFWTIPHNQSMPVPVVTAQGNVIGRQRLNAILYCRTLEQSSQKCIDNPLRSATRTAKIFIDGVQVSVAYLFLSWRFMQIYYLYLFYFFSLFNLFIFIQSGSFFISRRQHLAD